MVPASVIARRTAAPPHVLRRKESPGFGLVPSVLAPSKSAPAKKKSAEQPAAVDAKYQEFLDSMKDLGAL